MRLITFHLPADLIRKAKIFAAQNHTTVNALVRELLEEKVSGAAKARAAGERLLAIAERGPYFSIDPGSIRRDELHERR